MYAYPLKTLGERVWRMYRGGRELDKIENRPNPADGQFPELWMFSTTRAANMGREHIEEGICRVDGAEPGQSLAQIIRRHPAEMLGARHAEKYGDAPGVLIKLLDPVERLSIQVHPDKRNARALFSSRFGKTESWHILDVRPDWRERPCVYLGFREGVSRAEWEDCFRRQDRARMLGMLNRLEVAPGDTFVVHGGVPHAVSPGCLYLEIQEPTDFTIRTERQLDSGTKISDRECHLGLGERMFDCFDYDGKTAQQALASWKTTPRRIADDERHAVDEILGDAHSDCFRAEMITVRTRLEIPSQHAFSCLYVWQGEGILRCGDSSHALARNGQFFLPAACGGCALENANPGAPLRIYRIYGPR